MTELALPAYFDQAIKLMQPEKIAEGMALGPDPKDHLAAIKEFIDAGFDHVYVHQVGPNQKDFFHFYGDKVLPQLNLRATSSPNDKRRRVANQGAHSIGSHTR